MLISGCKGWQAHDQRNIHVFNHWERTRKHSILPGQAAVLDPRQTASALPFTSALFISLRKRVRHEVTLKVKAVYPVGWMRAGAGGYSLAGRPQPLFGLWVYTFLVPLWVSIVLIVRALSWVGLVVVRRHQAERQVSPVS
jgi:hypothetical protein